jgi:hypothetical protein
MWEIPMGFPLNSSTFISVFHRILDFKTGLNFHSGPFSFYYGPDESTGQSQNLKVKSQNRGRKRHTLYAARQTAPDKSCQLPVVRRESRKQ